MKLQQTIVKFLLVLLSLSAIPANAAIISYTDPSATVIANVTYSIHVNNGGQQTSAQYIGTDPANLSHTAFTASVEDTKILSDAVLGLTLSSSGPTGSRVASYFTGLSSSATYNPTFTASRLPQYTVNVSSSAGANSYTASGSVVDLDILSLLNFATLLNPSATSRSIQVLWHDTVDFIIPAAMVKGPNSLPGVNPSREYRWNVAAGLTGTTNLTLTTSDPIPEPDPVPEPTSLLLMGSSLAILGASSRWFQRRRPQV